MRSRSMAVNMYRTCGPGLMHGRLVIPIHNVDGDLVAYCGRSVDQTPPRYRVPPAFAKSEILATLEQIRCSTMDCMKPADLTLFRRAAANSFAAA